MNFMALVLAVLGVLIGMILLDMLESRAPLGRVLGVSGVLLILFGSSAVLYLTGLPEA